MPEGMTPAGAPPSPQGGGAPSPQQQQGSGIGGATMPAPNRGLEAAALAKLAVYTQGMQTILAALPVSSDAAKDIRESLNKLMKHVPPGAVSQGVQMTEAQRNLMQQRQQAPQIAAMRAAQPQMPPAATPPQPQAA